MRSAPVGSDRTDKSDIPLSAFPLLRSRDIDSIVDRLRPILGLQIAELPDGGAINARANCYGLSATAIWCCDYGAPVTLKFPEVDYFRLQFAYRGRGATTVNG